MAPSPHTPRSPSPSFSDSSANDDTTMLSEQPEGLGPTVSRPASPTDPHDTDTIRIDGGDSDDSVTCLWDDCGIVFTHLPTLIKHIHDEHIGVHKSNYTCEWSTCQRRGLAQTSRFALISHIRSHTGEKPFTCTLPECDKSFTRSDALAKHLRLQHNIEPPAPGRGGYRKRKRGAEDTATVSASTSQPQSATPAAGDTLGTFNTFKVEPSPFPDLPSEARLGRTSKVTTNGHHRSVSPQPPPIGIRADSPHTRADEEGYNSDALPDHLLPHYVPETGLVMGRSPAMAMYLLMKAKHRYALEQHDSLLEELRLAKAELMSERDEKEGALDQLLETMFGPQAEFLIPGPSGLMRPPYPTSVTNGNGL